MNSTPTQPPDHAGFVDRTLTADEWRTKAHKLWQLLDDIDTYFDMLKPKMEIFERKVSKKCQQRHEELHSDGYDLYPPPQA